MVSFLSTEDAGNQVIKWLSEIENCRRRSGSLKGPISKTMKINLWSAKGAIEDIITRKTTKEKENLQDKHYQELKEELNKMKEENKKLRESVRLLTEKLNSGNSSAKGRSGRLASFTGSRPLIEEARGTSSSGAVFKRPPSSLSVRGIPETREKIINSNNTSNLDKSRRERKEKLDAANDLLLDLSTL